MKPSKKHTKKKKCAFRVIGVIVIYKLIFKPLRSSGRMDGGGWQGGADPAQEQVYRSLPPREEHRRGDVRGHSSSRDSVGWVVGGEVGVIKMLLQGFHFNPIGSTRISLNIW